MKAFDWVKAENELQIIRKLERWSVMSYTKLPAIVCWSMELKNILSINVAEWSVILVGWRI